MSTARIQKTGGRYLSRRIRNGITIASGRRYESSFVTAVFYFGLMFLVLFVLWTVFMILLQAREQWQGLFR